MYFDMFLQKDFFERSLQKQFRAMVAISGYELATIGLDAKFSRETWSFSIESKTGKTYTEFSHRG
jgi:hypothetical protein